LGKFSLADVCAGRITTPIYGRCSRFCGTICAGSTNAAERLVTSRGTGLRRANRRSGSNDGTTNGSPTNANANIDTNADSRTANANSDSSTTNVNTDSYRSTFGSHKFVTQSFCYAVVNRL